MTYPKSEAAIRIYRLWNANAKKAMPYRNYTDAKRAHIGALIEARWAKVGTTIEVYNCTNGRLLGQYTRRATHVDFAGE